LQIYNFFCKVVAIYIKILPVATFYGQGMVELIDSQSAGSVYQRYYLSFVPYLFVYSDFIRNFAAIK